MRVSLFLIVALAASTSAGASLSLQANDKMTAWTSSASGHAGLPITKVAEACRKNAGDPV